MKQRGFTLAETMVTSAVLFLLVGMTALAVTSYLRSYRHYTQQSLRLRLAAKTLEVACFRLRSAESLILPLPSSLSAGPLRYLEREHGPCTLQIQAGKLLFQNLGKEKKTSLGPAFEIEPTLKAGFLVLSMRVEGQAVPLETQLSLRGIRRQ